MLRLLLNSFIVVGVVATNPYDERAPCSYGTPTDLEYYNDDSPASYFRMTTNGCMSKIFKIFKYIPFNFLT